MINLSTSWVTVTKRDDRQCHIIKKNEIENSIMQANERKFHQTEGHGQLQKGALLKDLGVLGTGPKVEDVLRGTYHPPHGTTRTTTQFLASLQRPANFKNVPLITYQEFCMGWRSTKERTSSSGPHFGHYS